MCCLKEVAVLPMNLHLGSAFVSTPLRKWLRLLMMTMMDACPPPPPPHPPKKDRGGGRERGIRGRGRRGVDEERGMSHGEMSPTSPPGNPMGRRGPGVPPSGRAFPDWFPPSEPAQGRAPGARHGGGRGARATSQRGDGGEAKRRNGNPMRKGIPRRTWDPHAAPSTAPRT